MKHILLFLSVGLIFFSSCKKDDTTQLDKSEELRLEKLTTDLDSVWTCSVRFSSVDDTSIPLEGFKGVNKFLYIDFANKKWILTNVQHIDSGFFALGTRKLAENKFVDSIIFKDAQQNLLFTKYLQQDADTVYMYNSYVNNFSKPTGIKWVKGFIPGDNTKCKWNQQTESDYKKNIIGTWLYIYTSNDAMFDYTSSDAIYNYGDIIHTILYHPSYTFWQEHCNKVNEFVYDENKNYIIKENGKLVFAAKYEVYNDRGVIFGIGFTDSAGNLTLGENAWYAGPSKLTICGDTLSRHFIDTHIIHYIRKK